MAISKSDIQEFLQLIFPTMEDEELQKKYNSLYERFVKKEIVTENYILIRNEEGELTATSWLYPVEAGKFAFSSPKYKDENSLESLLKEILTRYRELGGKGLICRSIHDQYHDVLVRKMSLLGFISLGDRIEYKTDISNFELSSFGESPIIWNSPLVDDSMNIDEIASLMEAVAIGDPDYDPETDNAKECIESYLDEDGLYVEKDCIQVGYLKDDLSRPCCFLVAQAEPSTGWARITYMGIHSEFRGKGLGVWVQRHGISLLKKQGGTEYHGGTNYENHGMRSVFEMNNCNLYRRMTEWKWQEL